MVENPEVLYVDGICRMIIAGKICGKKETAEVHQSIDGHEFQED